MIGIIVLLVISWILVWFFEKGNLSVLGFKPQKARLKYTALLFTVTALCCMLGFLMRMYFAKEEFSLHPGLNISSVLAGIWTVIRSVLFEELLCRGVALYILIIKLGQKKAILISALAFGLLHLNNLQSFGDVNQVLLTVLFPFLFGLVFAYAYAKSFSILLPLAMHLGWNLVQDFIFPGSYNGNTILILTAQPLVTVSYFVFYCVYLLPKIAAIVGNFLTVRRIKAVRISGRDQSLALT